MIRIFLTAEDLLRTRFASHPAPLIEVGHALAAMHRQEPSWGGWQRRAAASLPREARPLLELIPPTATGPLFLDPVSTSLAEGLDLVRRAPDAFVTAELQRTSGTSRPPSWVRLLAARDQESWRDLERALWLAYHHLLADDWPRVWSGFRSEITWRGRLIAEQGVRAALSALHPAISWDGSVLQIDTPRNLDFSPDGAGLTLLPSVLWTGGPQVGGHPDGSVVIVYPALTPLPLLEDAPADPLGGLLGRTRAAILLLAQADRTTTELAGELGISAASVSGHTKALRAAGLIVTTRAGKSVVHSLTPLGGRLLENAGSSPIRAVAERRRPSR
jgi:DNA-binding MarR family transcriptional regulator